MMAWTFTPSLVRGLSAGWRRITGRPPADEPEAPFADSFPVPPPREAGRTDALARARQRAALIEALSPSLPVASRDQLLGRESELRRMFSAIDDLRGHALVHGARGAGKTSLVRAFGDLADERGLLVLYLSCDGSKARFADLFRPYLDFLPDHCFARDELEEVRAAMAALAADFGPRALAAILGRVTGQRIVLIVDEFDRVTDPAVRTDIATLVKHLTDLRAGVHLLLVGIARDAHELVQGHASLRRHLVAIGLRPFGQDSANRLLDEGERGAGLRFDGEARALIAGLAAGSPYHLRLFAFSAAIVAIERGLSVVDAGVLCDALPDAFDNWAALNPVAAALFDRMAAEGPAQRRRLEALALSALHADVVTVEALGRRFGTIPHAGGEAAAAEMIERMAPALVEVGEGGGLMFEDTLAPQFLLLSCCLGERGSSVAGRNAA